MSCVETRELWPLYKHWDHSIYLKHLLQHLLNVHFPRSKNIYICKLSVEYEYCDFFRNKHQHRFHVVIAMISVLPGALVLN
jgi:hypothetical protein